MLAAVENINPALRRGVAENEEVPCLDPKPATICTRAHLLDFSQSDQTQQTFNDSRQYSNSFNKSWAKSTNLDNAGNVSLNVGGGASLVEKGLLIAVVAILALVFLKAVKA